MVQQGGAIGDDSGSAVDLVAVVRQLRIFAEDVKPVQL